MPGFQERSLLIGGSLDKRCHCHDPTKLAKRHGFHILHCSRPKEHGRAQSRLPMMGVGSMGLKRGQWSDMLDGALRLNQPQD